MRQLRIAILIFFIVVATYFSVTYIQRRLTTDYRAPVIQADSDAITVGIPADDDSLLAGMTARDNLDGDVTDTIVVVSRRKFIRKGTIHVNYAAFDNNKNVGTYTREVTYEGYYSPRFKMTSPLRYANRGTGYDYLENITAFDCIDGNITSKIKISMGNTDVVSEYATQQKINIQVTNSCGDSSVLELTVSMEDYAQYSKPAPSLSDYIVYVPVGGTINERSLLNGVWTLGSVKSFEESGFDPVANVRISDSSLNLNNPGVYTVVYRLIDSSGEQLGSATLIVVVED